MLSEIKQSWKDKYGMIPLIWGYLGIFIETESQMVVVRAEWKEDGEFLLMDSVSVLQNEKVFGGWLHSSVNERITELYGKNS